jgi:DNA-binding NarL/FixJ family response regulator
MPVSPRPLRIAIVNDYEVVVNGIVMMVSEFPGRVEIVECDFQAPVVEDVDIVLFDIFANVDHRGLGLLHLVRPGGPRVVVFSWVADARAVETARQQGAAGFLSKTLYAQDLVQVLEGIHAGSAVTGVHSGPVNGDGSGDWPGRDFGLTAREAEVLALIAQGLTND